ncbi:type II toxin-antitoxin system HipA family toxin [Sulfurimonas sp. NW7]|uniref:type II toxin-antitoxin system HipA family toxin n=1 Tax=Sulfurimonas sp. NW7 TaxID=2922727 RepID=UPI003DA994D0
MKKNTITRVQSEILDILIQEKNSLNLKEIILKLGKISTGPRAMQKEMSKLKDANRVSVTGNAASTQYSIQDVQRAYPGYSFLYVYKNNVIIGEFFKLREKYRFYYDSEYLAKYNKAIPTLPLQIECFDFDNIPAIFEENMLEGINREIDEVVHKTSDEFELLARMDDSIGDLCFSKSKERCFIEGAMASNYMSSLNDILGEHPMINILDGFEIRIEEEELFPEEYDLSKIEMKQTQGISGFQYKKLVNIDFEMKTITTNEKAHMYILKPYSRLKANSTNENYFPHISLNEHLHLSFAKNELGFRVPYSAIVKSDIDDEYHYIVKRFDRLGTNRFAKSSFAAFLGLRSENKYDTTSEKMFKRIAKELIAPKERMELLKHYVYSSIVVYEDLHTKNLSIIYDNEKPLFAPLYDVCCTGLYDSTKGYESRLPINGKQTKIRPNDYRGLCKILNIDYKEFFKEAKIIAQKYETKMPLYFNQIAKLGHIPFYHKKQVKKRGSSDIILKRDVNPVEFVNVLREFHSKRVRELKELQWIE